jgi:peptidoglycan/LPS O-acetylase OafA/YrhL
MAASVTLSTHVAVEQSRTTNRIPAFDFTKGVLVLFMVLYHWLNYFYTPQGKIYDYLRFLTPSFIFVTGFLISHVHISKYGIGNPKLPRRLFLRGLKLLGVFVLLNLLIGLALPDSPIRMSLFEYPSFANLEAIFLSGNVYIDQIGKAASFTILVPISYLLMVSAILLTACKFFKYTFHVICGLMLLSILLLDLHGMHSTNLELLTIGLLGVIFGYASGAQIQKSVGHPYAVGLAYCAYLGAITIWVVSFPLQTVGVFLTVMVIYMIGAKSGEPGRLRRHILVLGNYSLFGYISQIAILQILHRGLSHFNLGVGVPGVSLVAGFALTMISVEVVDRTRPKSATLDRFYRVVFA